MYRIISFITLIQSFVFIFSGRASKLSKPSPLHEFYEFKETTAEREARMQWFREAHFGMFIHWGLYSQLAGEWQDKTGS